MAHSRNMVWFAPGAPSAAQDERAAWLTAQGFNLRFINSLTALAEWALAETFECLVVSDHADHQQFRQDLMTMQRWPVFASLKTVISLEHFDREACELAALHGVRDLIPFHLPKEQWLYRILFALDSRARQFPVPKAALAQQQSVKLKVPARLICIRGDEIEIEAPVCPEVGDTLFFSCHFFNKLPQSTLALRVEAVRHDTLHYRFKNALTCRLLANEQVRAQLAESIMGLQHVNQGPQHTAFVVTQTANLRRRVFASLKRPRVKTVTALKFSNLCTIPPYINPRLVIIEGALCQARHLSKVAGLINALPGRTSLIVLGGELSASDQAKLHTYSAGHDLYFSEASDQPSLDALLARAVPELVGPLPPAAITSAGLFPDASSPYSYGRLLVAAELTHLHTNYAKLSLPYAIDPFALVQLQAGFSKQMLGRHPWLKMIALSAASPALTSSSRPAYVGRFLFAELCEGMQAQWRGNLARADAPLAAPALLALTRPSFDLERRPLAEPSPLTPLSPRSRQPQAAPPAQQTPSDDRDHLLASVHQEWVWLAASLLSMALAFSALAWWSVA